MTEPTKGYVIVASRKKYFYISALNLIDSIREFYPDANVCLVTEEKFVDDRGRKDVDVIIHCDDHKRAKLKGMRCLHGISHSILTPTQNVNTKTLNTSLTRWVTMIFYLQVFPKNVRIVMLN